MDPIMKTKNRILLSIFSGILTFCAFPNFWSPEYSFFFLIWFAHIPLLFAVEDQSPKQAFYLGALCGFIVNLGGYYWIADLIYTFGHLPWPISFLGMFLHSAYVGGIWALWAWGDHHLRPKIGIWAIPLLMACIEHYYPRIFPAYMGNSQFPWLSIMQIIDLFGVSAVTFLIYLVNAQLYLMIKSYRLDQKISLNLNAIITMILMIATLIYGVIRIDQIDMSIAEAQKLKVGTIQGNVGIFESETKQKRKNHLLIQQRLSAQAQAQGADLIVWSESSFRAGALDYNMTHIQKSTLPLPKDEKEQALQKPTRLDLTTPIRGFDRPLLFGVGTLKIDPNTQAYLQYNSAWLTDEKGEVSGKYDKNYRLAFGEYIPFGDWFPVFYEWLPAASHLQKGGRLDVLPFNFQGEKLRLGVLICYEGILPDFARDFYPKDPHVIFNLTNDDWFNMKAERYLHLTLAIPRSIEHRKTMVRSTLTGVSVNIDPVGRLGKMTKMEEESILVEDVPLLEGGTVYLAYGHWSITLAFLFLCFHFVQIIIQNPSILPFSRIFMKKS
jgi:apolipoprotein N-acyltransferase